MMSVAKFGRVLIASVLGVLSFGAPTWAEGLPQTLICTFDKGTAGSFEAGAFKTADAKPMSFTIEGINLEAQTAGLKSQGAGPDGKLSIVRAINANHFIEPIQEGFLNLTTIYDKDPASGRYPAVHSRHFGLLGEALFGQYTGWCREP